MTPRYVSQKIPSATSVRLKRLYRLLEIAGVIAPFAFAFLLVVFKKYFAWLGDSLLEIAGALFVMGCIYLLLVGLSHVFHKKLFLGIARYSYLGFFIYFIYLTGGVESTFIFLALIPVVLAAVGIDRVSTRNLGIATTVLFAGLIFFFPDQLADPALLVKHLIHVIFIGVMSYLVYGIVIETIRQRTETEEVAKRIDEMIQLDRMKNDFLSVAQHQLRTPLSGAKWALESLDAMSGMPDESRPLIEAGLMKVKDSFDIINQMLKTVDTNEKALMVNSESTDLVGMVRAIIAELNFVIVRKEANVSLISPDALLVNADKQKIKAALMNIIDNAVKYSPKGQVNVTIADDPTGVVLTVKDTGIGIASEDMPFIFERLHRGKNAVLMEPDESGVGLYTSKKIIELHGGTISVSSELGKGTTVRVVFFK